MNSTKIDPTTTAATAALTLGGFDIATLSIMMISAQNSPPPSLIRTRLSPLSPVSTLLTSTLQPVLGPTQQAARVTVGGADVVLLGVNCGVISLVR
jgi:hypothetical protein